MIYALKVTDFKTKKNQYLISDPNISEVRFIAWEGKPLMMFTSPTKDWLYPKFTPCVYMKDATVTFDMNADPCENKYFSLQED